MPVREHEQNRLSWNEATARHNSHKGDQAKAFREGLDTLHPEELELLGPLEGRSLVHLQCNSGQDTLSLARRGADVLGVDISDEAVSFARKLSADSGIPARFERSDLFDWFARTTETFDLAFASYGALGWLSDLRPWAAGVAKVLKPGGKLVLVEFHTVPLMFEPGWKLTWPYSSAHGAAIPNPQGVNDYIPMLASFPDAKDTGWKNPHPTVEFAWGIADVVQPLIDSGLALEKLVEWPYSNGWRPFPDMRPLEGGRWGMPEGMPEMPFMFGVVARKPR
jgi:SAM-dependent methyltransferase